MSCSRVLSAVVSMVVCLVVVADAQTYEITSMTSGGAGTISPSNTVVLAGGDTNVIVQAGLGYHIRDILVNSVSIGIDLGITPKIYTNTFTAVSADQEIEAVFEADFTELPVSSGLALWLDSTTGTMVDTLSTPAVSNDIVEVWVDQSPNGFEFTQSGGGSSDWRPHLRAGASPNGNWGLQFDGNDQMKYLAAALTLKTFIIAFEPAATITSNTTHQILMRGDPVNGEELSLGDATGTLTDEVLSLRSYSVGSDTNGGGTVVKGVAGTTIDGFSLAAMVHDDSFDNDWMIYLNGLAGSLGVGTDNGGFVFENEFVLIGAQHTSLKQFTGHIYEVLGYSDALTDEELHQVQSYLVHKYTQVAIYEITSTTSGDAGTISPSTTIVFAGGDTNVIVQADPGYHIKDILVNGVSIGADLGITPKIYTNTFTAVSADQEIEAVFEADFTELPVSSGLALWLDSTTGTMVDTSSTPAVSNEMVEVWVDQSPNGFEFAQSGGGSSAWRPHLRADASPNGNWGLEFDGTDQMTYLATALTLKTFIIAFEPAATITSNTAHQILMRGNPVNGEELGLGDATGTLTGELLSLKSYSVDSSGGTMVKGVAGTTIDGFSLAAMVHDDSFDNDWMIYLNGLAGSLGVGTDNGGFVFENELVLIGAQYTSLKQFTGHIYEVLGYSDALTDEELRQVQSYLVNKYTQDPPPLPSGMIIFVR